MEFDQYRANYDDEINRVIAFGGQEHAFYLQVKADSFVDLLRRHLPARDLHVLDVGCGNGTMHPFLLSSGLPIRLTGIEVAPQFVSMAREANPAVVYDVYDGQRLPYDADGFDAAVAFCVMHHIPPAEWTTFIGEMSRVVRPGGLVAVFEHNPFNPATAYIVRTCPIDRHAVLLRPNVLTGLMRSTGLAEVTREFILFTPFASPAFRGIDRSLRWLPLGAQYVAFGQVARASSG
jgi:SAM-dependent methyltransferase